jgi:hypothetical protein
MKLLEFRTALRTATKYDLFTGDLENMKARQVVKDSVTVFYLDQKTKSISGPWMIYTETDFVNLYHRMAHGLVGVITDIPNVVTNEFLFDLVLREATIDDLRYKRNHMKLNQIFYTYAAQKLIGPLYVDKSTTSLYLENLLARNQIFVPNERQHFKIKNLEKTG